MRLNTLQFLVLVLTLTLATSLTVAAPTYATLNIVPSGKVHSRHLGRGLLQKIQSIPLGNRVLRILGRLANKIDVKLSARQKFKDAVEIVELSKDVKAMERLNVKLWKLGADDSVILERIAAAEGIPGIRGKIALWRARRAYKQYRTLLAKYTKAEALEVGRLTEEEHWIETLYAVGPNANKELAAKVQRIVEAGGEKAAAARLAQVLSGRPESSVSLKQGLESDGSNLPPVLAAGAIGVTGVALFAAGKVEEARSITSNNATTAQASPSDS